MSDLIIYIYKHFSKQSYKVLDMFKPGLKHFRTAMKQINSDNWTNTNMNWDKISE